MRDLLELLIRLRWWFYGDHLRYDKYYDIARIRKLGLDPRANRRAHFKAELALAIGLLVAFEVGMITLEYQLHFDPQLGPMNLNVALPFIGLIHSTFTFAFTSYSNPHLDHVIHEAFRLAWTAFAYTAGASFLFSNGVFRSSRWDRSDLTTELGTARWATPDELTDKRGSLLPPGYDAVFGFSREARTKMRASANSLSIAMPTEEAEQRAASPKAWRAMLVAAGASLATFFGSLPSPTALALTLAAAATIGYLLREHLGARRVMQFAIGGALAGVALGGLFVHAAGMAATVLTGAGAGTFAGMLVGFALGPNAPKIELTGKTLTPALLGAIIVYGVGSRMHEPLALTIVAAVALAALLLIERKNLQPVVIAAALGVAAPYVLKYVPGAPAGISDPARLALIGVAIVAAFMITRAYVAPKESLA